ncbi:MAG: heme-binding domain-containing protein [Saprospiraceae bacterium]
MLRKGIYVVIILFVLIQVFRPVKNISAEVSTADIRNHSDDTVALKIISRACFDCHSNHTLYPWYAEFQPTAWYLQNHVINGKKRLNFSEFGTYTPKKAADKLEEIVEEIKKGEMPLKSYRLIHSESRLTDKEQQIVVKWAENMRSKYPESSK